MSDIRSRKSGLRTCGRNTNVTFVRLENDSSLDFARDCGYLTVEQHTELASLSREIGRMLGSMINNPGPFLTSDL